MSTKKDKRNRERLEKSLVIAKRRYELLGLELEKITKSEEYEFNRNKERVEEQERIYHEKKKRMDIRMDKNINTREIVKEKIKNLKSKLNLL